MTIRKRLTLLYAALLTAIIIIFSAIIFGVMRFTMISTIDDTLKETANLVSVNSRLDQTEGSSPHRMKIWLAALDVYRASGVYVQAWMLTENDYEWAGNSRNMPDSLPPFDPSALGYEGDEGLYTDATLDGVSLRVYTIPITRIGQFVGNFQVAADLKTVNAATDLLLIVMIISCGIAILGAVGMSLWFSHRALKPIENITQAAARIAGTDDLGTRLEWDGPYDELGRLISVFNRMMSRIEHLFSVQQRFIADISHELRTPLTAIRGNLDLVERYGLHDAELEAIKAETERMSRLVNDLLMLARVDYGGLEVDLYPMDLDTIVLETFEQTRLLSKDRYLDFQLNAFEAVRIMGNTDRIKQMLLNLLTNAVKFTDDGGQISVSLQTLDQDAVLTVSDTGAGIAADDLAHIFDRFYQSNPARTHTGGFGLGLSIAKWIVDAHNGKISVTSQVGKGTTFTIKLPVYDPSEHPTEHEISSIRSRIPLIGRHRQD